MARKRGRREAASAVEPEPQEGAAVATAGSGDPPTEAGASSTVASRRPAPPPPLAGFVLSGLLIGALPFWNGPVFVVALLLVALLFLLYPYRRYVFLMGTIAVIVGLPQIMLWRTGETEMQNYPRLYWGYTVENPTVARVLEYLGFTFGTKWLLIALGAILATGFQRRFLVVTFSLLALAFAVQFNIEVYSNHKFIHIWIILVNLAVAYAFVRLWRWSTVGRILVVPLLVSMTLGGVIDLFPIRNDGHFAYKVQGDPLTEWLLTKTKPTDVFLTHTSVLDRFLLAGRKIFYGHAYYAWSAGYPTQQRLVIYKRIYEGRDPKEVLKLLWDNNISYVAIDGEVRHNSELAHLNEALFKEHFAKVFEDPDGRYYSLTVYKVPTKEEFLDRWLPGECVPPVSRPAAGAARSD